MDFKQFRALDGFEWDKGNSEKNWTKHKVTRSECEEVFFNRPLVVAEDPKHSQSEERHYVLGRSDEHRRLFVVFTIRGGLIRVISARDMNKEERRIYNEEEDSEVRK